MADKQVAIKSIIAAMNSVSKIQQEKTKLLTNALQNNQKFANNFMTQMYKQKMQEQSPQGQMRTEALRRYKENPNQYDITSGGGIKTIKSTQTSPSWVQEQKIAAMRSGLKRGNVVIGKQFGEPSNYTPKNRNEAISAIEEAGLDPAMFEEELKRWDPVRIKDKKGKQFTVPQHQIDAALKQGYSLFEEPIEQAPETLTEQPDELEAFMKQFTSTPQE